MLYTAGMIWNLSTSRSSLDQNLEKKKNQEWNKNWVIKPFEMVFTQRYKLVSIAEGGQEK